MRILAIRGENLASLAAPFEIDLQAPPLAETGLFAIAGDTGAGKSTILDALCLALYNDYPRASGSDTTWDPGDDRKPLAVSSPQNILSRGAGSGHAEVDFIGVDGIAYRARWQVRRARGKAAGKLQATGRTLHRLDDGSAVAAGVDEVRAAIVARAGLTFEQFRRTVLLAQGEFDAFLLADAGKRAELLEKITGTEIYQRISQRVFEQTKERRRVLEDGQRRLGDIGVLDAAARAALDAERAEAMAQATAGEAACRALDAAVKRAGDILAARAALTAAETQLAHATADHAAAAPERDRLARLRMAHGLRPKAEALAQRRGEAADAAARQHAAQAALVAAEEARHVAVAAHGVAAEAAGRAAALIAEYEPGWAKAAAIDERIAAAEAERATACRAQQAAADAHALASDTAGRLTARCDSEQRTLADLAVELAAATAHAALAADRHIIEATCAQHADLVAQAAATVAGERKAASEMAALRQRHDAWATAAHDRASALDAAAAGLALKRAALAAIDRAALTAREEQMRGLAAGLSAATDTARRHDEAQAALATAQQTRAAARRRQRQAVAASDIATARQNAAATQRDQLRPLADLAEATLSGHAAALRSTLSDGEPCPVCGARDHPVAASEEAMQLARAIRQQRADCDAALRDAGETARAATLAAETAASQLRTAEDAWAAARHADAAAAAALAGTLPHILAAEQALGRAADADAAAAPLVRLAHAAQQLQAEIAVLSRQRRAADLLLNDIERLQHQRDLLAATDAAERAEAETIRAALVARQHEHGTLTERGRSLDMQRAAAEAQLAPYLLAADLDAGDLARGAPRALRRMLQRGAAYAERRLQHETLGAAHRDNLAARDRAAERAADAGRTAAGAEAEAQQRQRTAERLAAERASLLGGEPTVAHRARHLQAEQHLRDICEARRQAQGEADTRSATCRTARDQTAEAAHIADARCMDAAQAYETARARTGLAGDEASALLAVLPEIGDALAARLRQLDTALGEATLTAQLHGAAVAQLGGAADALEADALPCLRAQLADRQAANAGLRDRLTELRLRLARDEAERQRGETLAREVDEARAALTVWEAVDTAIGQGDGAKFRRFAQAVTLDQLMHLANDHLRALGPRYRLAARRPDHAGISDLSLTVVDRDMGGEERGANSLSGGERFLVSLALALALSGIEGRQSFVDTLFIDEGFGALDRDTLDMAVGALEALHGCGRKVGVITHVAAMIERIAVQVLVVKQGAGRSVVRLQDAGQGASEAWCPSAGDIAA